MIGWTRIGTRELAALCHRLGSALSVGLPPAQVFEREAQGHGSAALRHVMHLLSAHVGAGGSVADAMDKTGTFFPPLVRQLTALGEQTGNLPETLLALRDHYEHQLQMRRAFWSSILWPMLELGLALLVIGLLIYIMGILPVGSDGQRPDILGWGLTGPRGVLIYLAVVAAAAGAITLLVWSMRRGLLWTAPLQKLLLRIPGLGGYLQTLAMSRLCWTLHLTLNTGLDLRQAIPLCLAATQNARYAEHARQIVQRVAAGGELTAAFQEAGVFPGDFLDSMDVGERSGRLAETMKHQADAYRERAQRQMSTMAIVGGFLVGGLVLLFLVVVIVSILSRTYLPYIDTIRELTS
jgi:type II secretory pathway component PulF